MCDIKAGVTYENTCMAKCAWKAAGMKPQKVEKGACPSKLEFCERVCETWLVDPSELGALACYDNGECMPMEGNEDWCAQQAEKKLCIQAKRPCTTSCPAVVPACGDDCTDCKIHAGSCHKCAAAECLSYEEREEQDEEETTTSQAPATDDGACDAQLHTEMMAIIVAKRELKELETAIEKKKAWIAEVEAKMLERVE